MKFTIQPNRHRAFPPPFGIFFKRRVFRKRVRFSSNCRYDMEGIDYWDVNKIYGFGYASPWELLKFAARLSAHYLTFKKYPKPVKPHHIDSARWGSRYDKVNDRMSLYAYCYVNGEKSVKHLACVPMERDVDLLIMEDGNHQYWFEVKVPDNPFFSPRSYSLPFSHKKKWKYALGFYFGGNRKASHRMTAHIKNLPS